MIDPEHQQALLREYDAAERRYGDLAATTAGLINRILSTERIHVHSITHRTKTRASLADKLARPDKEYRALGEITDLAGIRVTTYWADDVDRVATLLEAEFDIDAKNSIDKRRIHDPDRFGYMSLHYVATLSVTRCTLPEYRHLGGIKFEAQIRSILQHSWAEMEHDLGYKTKLGVPYDIRRRFARLAGLLELADDEFAKMRDDLRDYERNVAQQIEQRPEMVELNLASLLEFIRSDSKMLGLDAAIAGIARTVIRVLPERVDDASLYERHLKRLAALNIATIGDLRQIVETKLALVVAFAERWLARTQTAQLRPGIGLLYLNYVLIAETGSRETIHKFLQDMHIGREDERERLPEKVLATYTHALNKVTLDARR